MRQIAGWLSCGQVYVILGFTSFDVLPMLSIRTSGTVKARNMDSDGSIDMGLQCIRMRIWNPISIHAIQAQ